MKQIKVAYVVLILAAALVTAHARQSNNKPNAGTDAKRPTVMQAPSCTPTPTPHQE